MTNFLSKIILMSYALDDLLYETLKYEKNNKVNYTK